jgi:hypothetical protein
VKVSTLSFGSGQRPFAGCCEHGDESWGSIKYEKFLGKMS